MSEIDYDALPDFEGYSPEKLKLPDGFVVLAAKRGLFDKNHPSDAAPQERVCLKLRTPEKPQLWASAFGYWDVKTPEAEKLFWSDLATQITLYGYKSMADGFYANASLENEGNPRYDELMAAYAKMRDSMKAKESPNAD